jgi:hypothetical protein
VLTTVISSRVTTKPLCQQCGGVINTSENHDDSAEVFLFSFGTIIINNRVFAYPPHFGGRNLLEHRCTKGLKA